MTPSDAQIAFDAMYNRGSAPPEERRRTMDQAKAAWGLLHGGPSAAKL